MATHILFHHCAISGSLSNILITALAVIIGGLITWGVSLLYYVKAAKGLKKETEELKKILGHLMILQKDEKGLYKPKLDENGNPIGLIGSMKGESKGASNVSGTLRDKNK